MSCNAYVCVLVCAGSVLDSVLRFTVLVQQLKSLLKCSLRSGDTNTSAHPLTCMRMILQMHLYSWYFLIIPLFFSFSLVTYVFVSLFCSFLSSCPFSVVLSLLFSISSLPSSPLPPSLFAPHHSAPSWLHLYHSKEANQPQSPGTAAAELVVHKQAFHTTAKCVGVVSLV